jgi:hypothetical protein
MWSQRERRESMRPLWNPLCAQDQVVFQAEHC